MLSYSGSRVGDARRISVRRAEFPMPASQRACEHRCSCRCVPGKALTCVKLGLGLMASGARQVLMLLRRALLRSTGGLSLFGQVQQLSLPGARCSCPTRKAGRRESLNYTSPGTSLLGARRKVGQGRDVKNVMRCQG